MEQLSTLVAARGPAQVSVLLILSAIFLMTRLLGSSGTSAIPRLGAEYGSADKRRKMFIKHASEVYKKGYRQFRDKVYRLTTADGEDYVVPRKFLDELRLLPSDHISSLGGFERFNEQKYIRMKMGDNAHTKFLIHILKSDLSRNLNRVTERLAEETPRIIEEELGHCDDWTPFVIHKKFARLVAKVSAIVLVGQELCRDEDYLDAGVRYSIGFFGGRGKLKQWAPRLRWLVQYFIPLVRDVQVSRRQLRDQLLPVIQRRKQMMKDGLEMPDDMIQWTLDKRDEHVLSDELLAELQPDIILAGIHTTNITTMFIIFDLVVRPCVIDELREELRAVLAANGGRLTIRALSELKLMDSVMKESQRLSPGTLSRFVRYVKKPLDLSDGTHIPARVLIQAQHGAIIRDPDIYPSPDTFNPRRFLDLRKSSPGSDQYQFASASKDMMAFGFGHSTCPGRFFAGNEIKLILANLVQNYDFKMPDDYSERYANVPNGLIDDPDYTKEILFRKRLVAT